MTYGCIRLIDCYRFLSTSLDSLHKRLVDNSHKTLKNLKEEIVDNDEISNIVNKIGGENKTIINLRKIYPEEVIKLEEPLLNYLGENGLEILKTEFPDKWKFLTKKSLSI